jgi:sodium-dependent dicarboxylate transporter 2/3/5
VRVGNKPANLIGGFMAASALISMWVSNTSTTLMMIPIALSVAKEVVGEKTWRHPFTIALMLGIAWSSSIGGLGTPIGTPPNVMLLAYFNDNLNIEINFIQWMSFAVPIVILMVPSAWFVLTKWAFDINKGIIGDGADAVKSQLKALGTITVPEKRTAILFIIISLSWATRPILNSFEPLANLSDTIIAVTGAIAMFIVPSGSEDKDVFLLDWDWAVRIPWGVILLFGGGLSMAAAISSTGLAVWLGEGLSFLTTYEMIFFIGILVALVIFLTELTSNTATTAALLPVLVAIAAAGNIDPILLAAPVAMAASCAFMFPVATAPNAIIFAGGQVTIPDMVRAGFRLNLFGIIIITTLCYTLLPLVFG